MKPNSSNRKLSAFALAARDAGVAAEITVDDVLEVRPGWSREEASDFLTAHDAEIGTAMVLAGIGAVLRLVEGRRHAN